MTRNNVIRTHDLLFPKQTRYRCVIFRVLFLKEVGFEPTMGNPTNLQFVTLNLSVIPSYQRFSSEI